MRLPREDFGVAWIRKPHPVGGHHRAAERAVARDGAVLFHQRAPEKRQQFRASFFCRGSPIFFVEFGVFDFAAGCLGFQNVEIKAAEDFLCACAVKGDQNDIFGFVLRLCGGAKRTEQQKQK